MRQGASAIFAKTLESRRAEFVTDIRMSALESNAHGKPHANGVGDGAIQYAVEREASARCDTGRPGELRRIALRPIDIRASVSFPLR
jgi:hypothetical protein